MRNESHGFVFLITLATIFIISLLLLTCMHHVLLYGKAINRQEAQHQRFYQIEDTMRYLVQLKPEMIQKKCMVHGKSANQTMELLAKKQGCTLINAALQYHYLIEDLGVFPCLVVAQEQQLKATRHTRITVLQNADDLHPLISILQVRTIKIIDPLPCQKEVHKVHQGISSWRYMADYQHEK